MNILVLGGTRFFGIHLVKELVLKGHNVTIATRGRTIDDFGDSVQRLIIERTNSQSMANAFKNQIFDVVCDDIAYCSNDVKALLDIINCKRYIMVSSTAIYNKHIDTKEEEYNPRNNILKWCSRMDFPYDEVKRQAENALAQCYDSMNWVAVRFPFVIGTDDYTKRLFFYVEHAVKGIPMYIDNLKAQLGFIRSDEAGKFLAFLAEQNYVGEINGSSNGTISIEEILSYVELKTGRKAILSTDGDKSPYNGEKEYSINTNRASNLGYNFTDLRNWIYELLDEYIKAAN